MPKFKVTFKVIEFHEIVVEAADAEAAQDEDLILKEWDFGTQTCVSDEVDIEILESEETDEETEDED